MPRNDADRLAFVLGDIVTEKFVLLETCGEEVNVVENGVLDVGLCEHGGELRLPNPFG